MTTPLRGQVAGTDAPPDPLPFPPDLPEAYTPRAFERIALEVARSCGLGLDVFAVDCTEFPCIAWTRAKDPSISTFTMDACPAWMTSFTEGAMVLGISGTLPDGGSEEQRYFGWMPAPPKREQFRPAWERAKLRVAEMRTALGMP